MTRGLALFGVLLMNLAHWFRAPPFGVRPDAPARGLDRVASLALGVLLAGKAMTLFSVLFGAGLVIFLERASARGPGAMRLLSRRLFVLLAIGVAHNVFLWHGDILVSYALAGFVALAFLRRRPAVLWAAVAACLVLPAIASSWPPVAALTDTQVPGHYEAALRAYGTGGYTDVVRFRLREHATLGWRGYVLFWPRELGNVLLGVLAWRSGVLRAPGEHLRALRWVAAVGLLLGLGRHVYRAIYAELYHPPPAPKTGWALFAMAAAILLCALGYGAGLLLLVRRARWRRWLGAFAPLGRMAFTNYLTQSIVFTTVFYGYGLRLYGKVGLAESALMGIAFYALQAVASTVWLRHFQFGPFEWLWRSLTYGRRQPFRYARAPG